MWLCHKVRYHVNCAWGVAKHKFGSNIKSRKTCVSFIIGSKALTPIYTFSLRKWLQLWVLQVKNTVSKKITILIVYTVIKTDWMVLKITPVLNVTEFIVHNITRYDGDISSTSRQWVNIFSYEFVNQKLFVCLTGA